VSSVGLMVNLEKPGAVETTHRLVRWLEERDVTPHVTRDVAQSIGRADLSGSVLEWIDDVDFVVVLGGDGTLLKAVKQVADRPTPLLGVNTGHLGFLTEVEVNDVFDALPAFLQGDYVVENRMMIRARVTRNGSTVGTYLALNDVVVSKGPFSRLARFDTYIEGTLVAAYPADGVIVSTSTGSTAYSLSAGGPIVQPNLDVIVVTPICPHTFYARSIVASKEETVSVTLRATAEFDAMLTIDGQEGLRRRGWSFYEVLRRKLAERGPADG